MPNDVVDQPIPLGVVHHVADQCAGRTPVVVGPQNVSGAHHFAVGVPTGGLTIALGVGARTPLEFGEYTGSATVL
jgi:hypothetical protein